MKRNHHTPLLNIRREAVCRAQVMRAPDDMPPRAKTEQGRGYALSSLASIGISNQGAEGALLEVWK